MPDLDHPFVGLEFVAFDTETTGLLPDRERVVEIAAVRFTADGRRGEFDELINPGQPIPGAAARVHGIGDDEVADKPDVGEVLPRFLEFIEGSVLLAHNAEFDVGFLAHEAQRAGIAMPGIPVVDTVEISRSLRPDLPNRKLETISKAIGLEAPTYHRALADAETLERVFLRMLEDARPQTLGDVLKLSAGALTFGPDPRLAMWLPPHLKPLEEALRTQGKVTILYEPEGKRQDTRDITPKGYMRRQGATFLMAFCEHSRSDRQYRLDWITRAQYAQATLF